MRRLRSLAPIACACALVPAPAAAKVSVTQHAVNVTLLHERTLARQTPRAQSDAQLVRERAQQCKGTLAGAPPVARRDLAGIYVNAVAGALWRTDRDGYRAWIERLAPAARADAAWRATRDRLRARFAGADRLYSAGVEDPCEVADAWRANDFDAGVPPDEVVELRHLKRGVKAFAGPPAALGRLLEAQHTRSAHRALAAVGRGVNERGARVIRAGDPVWAVLSR